MLYHIHSDPLHPNNTNTLKDQLKWLYYCCSQISATWIIAMEASIHYEWNYWYCGTENRKSLSLWSIHKHTHTHTHLLQTDPHINTASLNSLDTHTHTVPSLFLPADSSLVCSCCPTGMAGDDSGESYIPYNTGCFPRWNATVLWCLCWEVENIFEVT